MSCAEFQRWLDDGRPGSERLDMIGHAAECVRCKRELAAAIEIERTLAVVVPVAVSSAFNDVVLRRIQSRSRSGWRRTLGVFAHIMAEPLVPLSVAVAVMIGWYRDVLAIQLTAGVDRLIGAIDRMPLFSELTIVRAMAVAALILCVSWRIFRVAASAHT